jgi:hypothetical protein
MADLKSSASADVSKLETQIGYVRMHWALVSIVVVGSAIIGVVIGYFLPRL